MSTLTFRPLPEWEGYYAVTPDGRVFALERSVPGRPGRLINRKQLELKQYVTKSGHSYVALTRQNRKRNLFVHRAVLMAYVGPCPEGLEACHNDGDPSNNTVGNLRWDTHSANTFDKVRHGRHPMAKKTHCIHGHPFTPENTYHPPGRVGRYCITCRTESKRRFRLRAKALAA